MSWRPSYGKGAAVWDLTIILIRDGFIIDRIKDLKKIRAFKRKPSTTTNYFTTENTRIMALRTSQGIDRDGDILADMQIQIESKRQYLHRKLI